MKKAPAVFEDTAAVSVPFIGSYDLFILPAKTQKTDTTIKKRRYTDLTGRRFGKLTVLSVATTIDRSGRVTEKRNTSGRILWKCRCDCGGMIEAPGTQLTAGYRKSCGCLSRPERKDWIGKRFGKLLVISYAGKAGSSAKNSGSHLWNCICDCGNEVTVTQSNLKSGHTTSCGCKAGDLTASRHLVEGTCIEAIRSKKVFKTNTSGVRGVYPVKKSGKWAAQIMFQGKKRYLGCYSTIEEAAAARAKAEECYEEFLKKWDAAAKCNAGD